MSKILLDKKTKLEDSFMIGCLLDRLRDIKACQTRYCTHAPCLQARPSWERLTTVKVTVARTAWDRLPTVKVTVARTAWDRLPTVKVTGAKSLPPGTLRHAPHKLSRTPRILHVVEGAMQVPHLLFHQLHAQRRCKHVSKVSS
jgi:hypothetical protein